MWWKEKINQLTEWAGMRFGNFLGIFNQKTTPAGVIKKEFNAYPVASRQMEDNINLWYSMYKNQPPWATCDIRPLGLPGAIGRELSRSTFAEFSMTISGGPRADYLNQQIEVAKTHFAKNLELGLCLGGIAMKPYVDNGRILVDAATTNFTPTRFDGTGKAIGGVFRSNPTRNGDMWFIRMEYHDFQVTESGTVYTVKNKAFRSDENSGIGTEVPLNSVPEWAGILPERKIADLTKPLFSYFKPPSANRVEPESMLGVSVYSGDVAERIKEADEQWAAIRWEYESGERKIMTEGTVEPEQVSDRLFVKGVFTKDGDLFQEFSPEFRSDPLYQGLQYILKIIEFNTGLAFGTISDPQTVEKTATQEIMTKKRQYVTIADIKTAFQAALDDLIYAIDALCSLYTLAPAGDYEVEYNWGDGVLDDPDTRRQDMAMDAALVNQGLLAPYEFRMTWYDEDEATAKRMIAEINREAEEVQPVMEETE